MCRLVAYLGEEISLGALVEAPSHSLLRQSWQARELTHATVNADGWGAALYVPGDPAPCRYVHTLPIWADVNRPHLGRALRSGCILAAVRSATDSATVAPANTQPFVDGSLAFVHNGFAEPFATTIRGRILAALSPNRLAALAGPTDSEHLFAWILQTLDERGAAGPGDWLAAAAQVTGQIGAWAVEEGGRAIFSLVLTDGRSMVALRRAHGAEPPSLYLLQAGGAIGRGTVIASEPLDDDPGWTPIPADHGVVVESGAAPQLGALP